MKKPVQLAPGARAFLVLLVLFSAFMLWQAFGISGFSSITSPGAFPMLAALVMLLCLVVVLWSGRQSRVAEPAAGEGSFQHFVRAITPPVVLSFGLTIAIYMLLLDRLGFVVSSYLFLLASMRLLGSARWGLNLLVAALSLAAIYLIFQTVFSVVLPKGAWLGGIL